MNSGGGYGSASQSAGASYGPYQSNDGYAPTYRVRAIPSVTPYNPWSRREGQGCLPAFSLKGTPTMNASDRAQPSKHQTSRSGAGAA
jgi:hypothetical protein